MSRHHDKWYTRIFSDPKIVEELLRSFVHEDFVKDLDFASLKKLNTKFIPVSEKSRHADVVYEIKSRGNRLTFTFSLSFNRQLIGSWYCEWDDTYLNFIRKFKDLVIQTCSTHHFQY